MTAHKIILRADGDHEIGMGHVYRMLRLAQALLARGHSVVMSTLSQSPGETLFRSHGLTCATLVDRSDFAGLAALVRAHDPSLVAIDILDADPELYHRLRNVYSNPIIAFDDRGPAAALADAVINSITFVNGPPEAPCKNLFEGPAYMILAPEFSRAHRSRGRHRVKRIFMGFGGSDTRQITARALRMMEHIDRSLDVTVNFGPACEQDSSFRPMIDRSHHVIQLVRNPKSMATLYEHADFAICAGGIMLYELAAVGCPAAAIAAEPHERATIGYWAARGAVADLGWERDFDINGAVPILARLVDDLDTLERMQRAGPATIDALGLVRCVDIVEARLG